MKRQVTTQEIESYLRVAQEALLVFQLIEEALKSCILLAHGIVNRSIPGGIAFKYSEDEYKSMPLERLLNVFGKFTTNDDLMKQLNALRAQRNHIAHRSFALAFLSNISDDVDFYDEFKKVETSRDASRAAFDALTTELNKFDELQKQLAQKSGAA